MRWLLFLSRVAFICNLLFLLSFSLLITDWISNESVSSTIIITGYVFAVLFNPAVALCYLAVFWISKNKLAAVPSWLIVMNVIFLFLQLVFLLLLNVADY